MIGKIGIAAHRRRLEPRLRAGRERERRPASAPTTPARPGSWSTPARNIRQRAFYYTHVFADHEEQGHRLRAEHERVPLDRRRQDVREHRQRHARRPPRPLDRSGRSDSTSCSATTAAARSPSTSAPAAARRGPAQDFPTAQFYHVITTKHVPYHVCGAQQDNSTMCVPSTNGMVGPRRPARRSSRSTRSAATRTATSRPIRRTPTCSSPARTTAASSPGSTAAPASCAR